MKWSRKVFREQNLNWEIEEIGGDVALVGEKVVGGDAGEVEVEEDKGDVVEDGVVAGEEMVDVEIGEEVGGAMVGTLIVTIKGTKIIIIYYNSFVLVL